VIGDAEGVSAFDRVAEVKELLISESKRDRMER
jgi:hypothetical protein